MAYEPITPPSSWREMRRTEEETALALDADRRLRAEQGRVRRRAAWLTFCRCVGVALGVLMLLVVVATGVVAGMGRKR